MKLAEAAVALPVGCRATEKDRMQTKHAGMGAALAVLLAVFGLITLVGVILLMMLFQPGIDHSPAQVESRNEFRASPVTAISELPDLGHTHYSNSGVHS